MPEFTGMMQTEKHNIQDLNLDGTHIQNNGENTLPTATGESKEHYSFGDDRVLREGNRVTGVARKSTEGEWSVTKIDKMYCKDPENTELGEGEQHVIVFDATLAPASDNLSDTDADATLMLTDILVRSSQQSIDY